MAITQEVKIEKIEITKLDSSTYPELHIHESVCFDDPEDNTLPHLTERVRVFVAFSVLCWGKKKEKTKNAHTRSVRYF